MGLDNGIVLQTKRELEIPPYVYTGHEYLNNRHTYEICYWRKCCSIRDMILRCINAEENDDGRYDLSIKDIERIRDGMYKVLCNADDFESSFWSFEDMIGNIAQCIVNLTWLLEIMRNDMFCRVCFYDSY